MYLKNIHCKVQVKNMSYEKRNYSLISKVCKSIYLLESTSRFIYEHICIDLWF